MINNKVFAFETDTVWGLGADINSECAIKKIYELKHREDLQDKTILISTHGAAVRAMINNIEKCEISQFWRKGVHKNCGVSCVELIDGEYQILWENKIYY